MAIWKYLKNSEKQFPLFVLSNSFYYSSFFIIDSFANICIICVWKSMFTRKEHRTKENEKKSDLYRFSHQLFIIIFCYRITLLLFCQSSYIVLLQKKININVYGFNIAFPYYAIYIFSSDNTTFIFIEQWILDVIVRFSGAIYIIREYILQHHQIQFLPLRTFHNILKQLIIL